MSILRVEFVQVCELDIIFNFEKAYFMWDEFVIGGDVQETSKKNVLKAISDQDMIQEVTFAFFCSTLSNHINNIHMLGNFILKV